MRLTHAHVGIIRDLQIAQIHLLRKLTWEIDNSQGQKSNAKRDETVKTEPQCIVRRAKCSNRMENTFNRL